MSLEILESFQSLRECEFGVTWVSWISGWVCIDAREYPTFPYFIYFWFVHVFSLWALDSALSPWSSVTFTECASVLSVRSVLHWYATLFSRFLVHIGLYTPLRKSDAPYRGTRLAHLSSEHMTVFSCLTPNHSEANGKAGGGYQLKPWLSFIPSPVANICVLRLRTCIARHYYAREPHSRKVMWLRRDRWRPTGFLVVTLKLHSPHARVFHTLQYITRH